MKTANDPPSKAIRSTTGKAATQYNYDTESHLRDICSGKPTACSVSAKHKSPSKSDQRTLHQTPFQLHNFSGFCYHKVFFFPLPLAHHTGRGKKKNLVLPRTCKQHSKSSYPSPSAPSRKDVSNHAGKISGCQEEMPVPKARQGQK